MATDTGVLTNDDIEQLLEIGALTGRFLAADFMRNEWALRAPQVKYAEEVAAFAITALAVQLDAVKNGPHEKAEIWLLEDMCRYALRRLAPVVDMTIIRPFRDV